MRVSLPDPVPEDTLDNLNKLFLTCFQQKAFFDREFEIEICYLLAIHGDRPLFDEAAGFTVGGGGTCAF